MAKERDLYQFKKGEAAQSSDTATMCRLRNKERGGGDSVGGSGGESSSRYKDIK